MRLREDADFIIQRCIQAVLPDEAVFRALEGHDFGTGRVVLVSAGKAAWQMARAAEKMLKGRIEKGVVVTKYRHVKGPIANFLCVEAGHPVPDENSFRGTQAALDAVSGLSAEDTVLFLLSGGGSALFEKPLVPAGELAALTERMLASGADITEINTVRKRLSAVKGGKFALMCAPARVFSVVLSDVLGDPLDMIASGPAYPDSTTAADALRVIEKYRLPVSPRVRKLMEEETPKRLDNVETTVSGSVRELCRAAADAARSLGYEPVMLTDRMACEAREAGAFLGAIAQTHAHDGRSVAYIAGGETVVHVTGSGLGGRNQEIALSASGKLEGLDNAALFSLGSDGTDGPTDAAGGYADGNTARLLRAQGLSVHDILRENDAYHALERTGGLIVTGPTGTNVNDVSVLLIRGE